MSACSGSITDVQGIRVGHYTDFEAQTGCTVVLCQGGTVGGVALRGGCPGTRDTPMLEPGRFVPHVHAILLTGGTVYGLDATAGVMQYLEERGIGHETPWARLPLVPAAVVFDLAVGCAHVRPTPENAYDACLAATDGPIEEGSVGVGTGADVGKLYGHDHASKGGVGTASLTLPGDVRVAALAVVNAFGDVVDARGEILAGARDSRTGEFTDTERAMKGDVSLTILPFENTTLVVVATDAKLTKEMVNKVAQMADDGLARAIRPAHTMLDGDAVFALATCDKQGEANVNVIGAAAAVVTAQAIRRAVLLANHRPTGG